MGQDVRHAARDDLHLPLLAVLIRDHEGIAVFQRVSIARIIDERLDDLNVGAGGQFHGFCVTVRIEAVGPGEGRADGPRFVLDHALRGHLYAF